MEGREGNAIEVKRQHEVMLRQGRLGERRSLHFISIPHLLRVYLIAEYSPAILIAHNISNCNNPQLTMLQSS